MSIKVDIIYTWVNNDQQFTDQLNAYSSSNLDKKSKRYRDIHETLKYSLRSIEQFAPWINRIHIITQRPQVPDWLEISNEKIQVVHHDQFIPAQYLPTFNPRVIQSFFHLIPNSSDYLIYFNDDYLLANHVSLTDFLSASGKIKVYGSVFGIPLWFRVFAQKNQIKGLPHLEHFPFLIYKPYWERMLKLRPIELEKTRNSKFRLADNIRVDRLYRYYLLSKVRSGIEIVFAWKLKKISAFLSLKDDLASLEKISITFRKQPKFLCINDDQSESPDEQITSKLIDIFEDNYPNPSSFEKKQV